MCLDVINQTWSPLFGTCIALLLLSYAIALWANQALAILMLSAACLLLLCFRAAERV